MLYYYRMESKEDLARAAAWQLVRLLNKRSRIEERPIRYDADVELSPREIHTIQAIGEQEEINVSDVAAYFGVSKSAASQMVRKLVDKGFVEKAHAAHSNREFRLSLTKSGRRAFRAHERLHGRLVADLTDRLGAFSLSQIATASVMMDVMESVLDGYLSEA
jgi:DNA-binding MarR family transcriptional regulator